MREAIWGDRCASSRLHHVWDGVDLFWISCNIQLGLGTCFLGLFFFFVFFLISFKKEERHFSVSIHRKVTSETDSFDRAQSSILWSWSAVVMLTMSEHKSLGKIWHVLALPLYQACSGPAESIDDIWSSVFEKHMRVYSRCVRVNRLHSNHKEWQEPEAKLVFWLAQWGVSNDALRWLQNQWRRYIMAVEYIEPEEK